MRISSISIKFDMKNKNIYIMELCSYLSIRAPGKKDMQEVKKLNKIISEISEKKCTNNDEIKDTINSIISSFNRISSCKNYIWVNNIIFLDITNGEIDIPHELDKDYKRSIYQSELKIDDVDHGVLVFCDWSIIDKNNPFAIIYPEK